DCGSLRRFLFGFYRLFCPPSRPLISAKFLRTSPGTPGGTVKLLAGLRRRLFRRNLQRDDEECAPPPEHHLTSQTSSSLHAPLHLDIIPVQHHGCSLSFILILRLCSATLTRTPQRRKRKTEGPAAVRCGVGWGGVGGREGREGSRTRSGTRMARPSMVRAIGAEALVVLLEGGLDRVVLIDSRPFVDYNTSHILEAVNVNCSKLMKRRLQQDKVQIAELLQHSAKKKVRQDTGGVR
ncbi:hypothetical protein ILYODFUR_035106, partial [Ilyodon furcidens]